jgi:hypothetical protein
MATALIVPKPNPWDRREKESAEQYNAFTFYRDLPKEDRNITRLAEHLGMDYVNLLAWSRRNAWRMRTAEYDAYVQELRGVRTESRRLEAALRHAESAASLHRKVTERIEQLKINQIKPSLIAPLLRIAVETERLALGEAPPQQSGSVVMATADGLRVGVSWGSNTPTWLPKPTQPIVQDTTTHPRLQGTRGTEAPLATRKLEEIVEELESLDKEVNNE